MERLGWEEGIEMKGRERVSYSILNTHRRQAITIVGLICRQVDSEKLES